MNEQEKELLSQLLDVEKDLDTLLQLVNNKHSNDIDVEKVQMACDLLLVKTQVIAQKIVLIKGKTNE